MIKAVVFGGTTEGRKICEVSSERGVSIRYCAATDDGARPVENLPHVTVNVGRLTTEEMTALITQDNPEFVIDATHPYAEQAGKNIRSACNAAGVKLLRILRDETGEKDFMPFDGITELLDFLEREPGNIFLTTGSVRAGEFTRLTDYKNRVWLRVLPNMDSLCTCLDLGFRPERIICMQGPFSEELNRAMFRAAGAKILVTKNSGAAGGFAEKLRAAQSLGMITAVLKRPEETGGITLEEVLCIITELST